MDCVASWLLSDEIGEAREIIARRARRNRNWTSPEGVGLIGSLRDPEVTLLRPLLQDLLPVWSDRRPARGARRSAGLVRTTAFGSLVDVCANFKN
jgi:hypothetical protein